MPPSDNKSQGLPPEAYQEVPGDEYPPYVPASESPPEITVRSVLLGALFGILFGAANAYLGLRVGLTISTSIPVAVLTVVAFSFWRGRGDQSRILEANMSQTIGSASSSVASGIIFTLPALFLWGLVPGLGKMTTVALAGGLLGVLFMVPLRRYLMKSEHGRLPYPEGTACAEVLVASEIGGTKARDVFFGIGIGALYRFFQGALRLWHGDVSVGIPFLPKGQLGLETSPALLGVGYILGPRIANVMVGGGLLAWLVIIPTIAWIGQDWTTPFYPETEQLVRDMAPGTLWTRYVRYVGAGAVAMGGLVTLIRALPTIIRSFRIGWEQIQKRVSGGEETAPRTDKDLSLTVVLTGVGIVVGILAIVPHVLGFVETAALRVVAAVLVAVFAFFFVTVSSRIVGLVGVTSNPTSGMTIATLLGTSGIFLYFGWTDLQGQAAALTVGAVVAVAASIAGDTSQEPGDDPPARLPPPNDSVVSSRIVGGNETSNRRARRGGCGFRFQTTTLAASVATNAIKMIGVTGIRCAACGWDAASVAGSLRASTISMCASAISFFRRAGSLCRHRRRSTPTLGGVVAGRSSHSGSRSRIFEIVSEIVSPWKGTFPVSAS